MNEQIPYEDNLNYNGNTNDSSEFEANWQNFCQLTYDSLIITKLKDFKSVSQVKWSNQVPNTLNNVGLYKMIFYVIGIKQSYVSSSQKSLLSQFQIWIPKTEEDQGNVKLKPIVNEIDLFEESQNFCVLEEFPSEKIDASLFAIASTSATRTTSKDIKLFKNNKFREGQVSSLKGHKSQIITIKHDPFSHFQHSRGVISGDQNGQMLLWDLNKSQGYCNFNSTKKFKNSGSSPSIEGVESILGISWMPKNSQISFISCSNSLDCAVTLWDIRAKSQENTKYVAKNGHTGTVNAICPLGKSHFVSGGSDGKIIFWDIRNQRNYIQKEQSHTQVESLISLAQSQSDIGLKGAKTLNKNSKQFYSLYQSTYLNKPVSFASCNKDGTVIIWNDSLQFQFIHNGHFHYFQGKKQRVVFDYRPYEELFISGQTNKNSVMLWRPGFFSHYHQKTMLLEGRNIKQTNFNMHEKMKQNEGLFRKFKNDSRT